jgi:membrane-bound lytic murein transglycosylase B
MGQVQFIPTTFREYAVDFDGDRRRDLWANLQDIFGSAANYLSSVGWDGTKTWGREVRLPKGFDLELAGLGVQKSLAEWQALGVRRRDGRDLPKVDIAGSVVLPAGHDGPVFMVYKNFRKIMVWNRSIFYALAVGHLADRIAGRSGPISRVATDEKPMSRDQVMEMQGLLVGKGFGIGEPDGIIGSKTRAAIKSYQKQAGLPPDGHPNLQLLQHLRQSQ